MRKKTVQIVALTLLCVVLFLPVELLAASFYEGKVLRIIVGSQPGGGYDIFTRIIARHLTKYIPGKPNIIVFNVPGAGSMIAANSLYNLEKPDGLTIGTFIGSGLSFAQLLRAPGVRFDLRKFAWIGAMAKGPCCLAVRSELPYYSIDDLRKVKEPIPLSTSGPTAQNYQFPVLLKAFAGINFKFINYPSVTESLLALQRKEVDSIGCDYSPLKSYIERGLLRPLIRGRIEVPGIENLPIDETLTTDKKGTILMAMRSSADVILRPYVAPPKTPPNIMRILQSAFAQLAKDPVFVAESMRSLIMAEYVPVGEVTKVLNTVLGQREDIVEEFSKFIKF